MSSKSRTSGTIASVFLSFVQWGYFLLLAACGYFLVMALMNLSGMVSELGTVFSGELFVKMVRDGVTEALGESSGSAVACWKRSVENFELFGWSVLTVIAVYFVLLYSYLKVAYSTQRALISDTCSCRMVMYPFGYIFGTLLFWGGAWVCLVMAGEKLPELNNLSGDKSALMFFLGAILSLLIGTMFLRSGRKNAAKKLSYYAQKPSVETFSTIVNILDMINGLLLIAAVILPFIKEFKLAGIAFMVMLGLWALRWLLFLIMLELFRQAAVKVLTTDKSLIKVACGLMTMPQQVQIMVQAPAANGAFQPTMQAVAGQEIRQVTIHTLQEAPQPVAAAPVVTPVAPVAPVAENPAVAVVPVAAEVPDTSADQPEA